MMVSTDGVAGVSELLFKPRARPVQRENLIADNEIGFDRNRLCWLAARKICDSLTDCAPHK